MNRIDAATLHAWLTDGHELALLDAREEGEFGISHLFWAVPCPLSRREIRARALLPRLATRIVCVDDGRGLDEKLALWLEGLGATDVAVLDGGTPAWAAAGHELFSGVNVPSKTFGEWVAHHYGTESVEPAELMRWLDEGRNLVVLDSRTYEEFRRMSIPTGISVPGAELVYRIGDLVPDPETLVVVNCAGRTRSILGAESLRRVGIPNRVLALRDGTMGWELAGLTPARGRSERFAAGRPATAGLALARARAFAESSGVGVIGPLDLARFEEDPDRTCYVLDVRDPAEFVAGHRPGSVSAPGGQLLQATDFWIGLRRARIALIDDDGVRARMTGAWLRQMGHRDVFVVEGGLDDATVPGTAPVGVPELAAPVETIDADTLAAASDTTVVDLARSIDFRDGHIPGAHWGVRTRLDLLREKLAVARLVTLTSPDGVLARLAVPEVKAMTRATVRVLAGGTAAWTRAAHRLARDRTNPPDEACIDFYLRPYDRNSGVEEAMQAYLRWEMALVDQIARDGTVAFGVPGGP
jgi:rhodanese-related sulfurtransferase